MRHIYTVSINHSNGVPTNYLAGKLKGLLQRVLLKRLGLADPVVVQHATPQRLRRLASYMEAKFQVPKKVKEINHGDLEQL